MTKEEAYKVAEQLLSNIYQGNFEAVAQVVTASADKDAWKLVKMLEEVIKFEQDIIKALKQK